MLSTGFLPVPPPPFLPVVPKQSQNRIKSVFITKTVFITYISCNLISGNEEGDKDWLWTMTLEGHRRLKHPDSVPRSLCSLPGKTGISEGSLYPRNRFKGHARHTPRHHWLSDQRIA